MASNVLLVCCILHRDVMLGLSCLTRGGLTRAGFGAPRFFGDLRAQFVFEVEQQPSSFMDVDRPIDDTHSKLPEHLLPTLKAGERQEARRQGRQVRKGFVQSETIGRYATSKARACAAAKKLPAAEHDATMREALADTYPPEDCPPSFLLAALHTVDHNFADDELERVTQKRGVIQPIALLVRIQAESFMCS